MEFSPNPTTEGRVRKSCRLILFPLPFQGHINPMFQLGNILHSRGYEISIIHTQFNSPDPSKYPHFTFHPIPDGLSESGAFDHTSVVFFLNLVNDKCAEPFQQCLARILSDDKNDYAPCIITDAIWNFTQAVADKFNLRRIVLRTSNLYSFLAFIALPSLCHDNITENPFPDLPHLKVKDIPSPETEPLGPEFVYKMTEGAKKASCIVFNTFKELEETELAKLQNQFRIPVFAIGPFHKCFSAASTSLLTQDRSTISWLDKQAPKSVLYVSFGSVATMDEASLLEVAWGLANSKQPFLWAIRPGMIKGSSWPELLPAEFLSAVRSGMIKGSSWPELLPAEFLSAVRDRSHIVQWAPQQEVLAHSAVSAFWTHCGWNSTLESICEGVPMICSWFLGDQLVNSRWISDVWRVGVKLEEGLQRGEIEMAIRTVMAGHEGEEMRQRILGLREMANHCLKPGGSSYQALDGLVSFISSFASST